MYHVPSSSVGEGLPAGLVREGDHQNPDAECDRRESDRRAERPHGGDGTGEAKIHSGADEAADRGAEGERGCAGLGAE
jgi:hypothetical protein